MTDWGKLLTESEVKNAIRERKKDYLEKTIWRKVLEEEEGEGWFFYADKNESKVKVRKNKPRDEVFENRVWVLFASMGFTSLNRDRKFSINYSQKGESLTKQIDVFAADDETVLVIECKCAESPKEKQWKTDLEAINGYKNDVRKEILKEFPNHKVKFIFATENYIVGDQDLKRMDEFDIAYFDEKTIKYYEDLVKHLGTSARYQLLGALFANQKIDGMDNRIPAIRGKMGGYTYYVFSIQPETLLKIGYVLHRSEANDGMMPTYQRIIKKNRLKAVHEFIEKKGFFPNSILISIDSKSKLRFDLADKQGSDDVTKLGILRLPNVYRSAYIIDGQHRLYGYSGSKYAKTNSIPVVAFENMDQKEQVKLFMEINENQKAVSKNLRNTLNADLLWVSDNPIEKREALRSKLAQDLGDSVISPLCDRIIIGEDQADSKRIITLDTICLAVDKSGYLSKYGKDLTLTSPGLFDLDDNDKTLALLEKYIVKCFSYVKELLPNEWEVDPKKEGIILINNGVGGFIRLFADIAEVLREQGHDPRNIDSFVEETHYYLDPLQSYFEGLSDDEKTELRSNYGTNGPVHYQRNLQKAIHDAHPAFTPEGYEKYWEDHGKSYNEESIKIMANAESACRKHIKMVLETNYPGNGWMQEIPKKIFTSASTERSKHQRDTGMERDLWEFFSMEDLKTIALYGQHWSSFFEDKLTLPSESKKAGGKSAKTEWMTMIDKLQKNAARATFSVAKTQYETLKEVDQIVQAL